MKIAIVTGVTSGIGKAIALRLHKKGMRVVGCARRRERLEALTLKLGENFTPVVCDLRNEDDIKTLFEKAKSLGQLSLLVNNAGVGYDTGLIKGESEKWRAMLELNVLALSICTREAIALMGNEGHIVHISSMAAHRIPPGSGMYSATKYAVRALTEALRQELRENNSRIRVSSISPGYVRTEFHNTFNGRDDVDHYAGKEVLESEDVANALEYLLSQPEHVQVHDVLMRSTSQKT